MNTAAFLENPKRYFDGSYDQFCAFGGPCVYFHHECLRAGREEFLSKRHVEMLYATLTAWGMHRMGEGKTKLVDWAEFKQSLTAVGPRLKTFRKMKMLELSTEQYAETIQELRSFYCALKLSQSQATVVINSKALYHLLPDLVPPIDRQYTIRFFRDRPEKWRDKKGKYANRDLPKSLDDQFALFHKTCRQIKELSTQIEAALFEEQRLKHDVTGPKAMDNAIVNFVKNWGAGDEIPNTD